MKTCRNKIMGFLKWRTKKTLRNCQASFWIKVYNQGGKWNIGTKSCLCWDSSCWYHKHLSAVSVALLSQKKKKNMLKHRAHPRQDFCRRPYQQESDNKELKVRRSQSWTSALFPAVIMNCGYLGALGAGRKRNRKYNFPGRPVHICFPED